MPKTGTYSATDAPYHYPDGVLSPGESVELTDEQAERGLASGALVATPEPSEAAPKAPPEPEETP